MLSVSTFGMGIEVIANNADSTVYYKNSAEKDNYVCDESFHIRSCRK